MATSAVCVTGLSVVDLGKDLTLFGQAIILFLIQLGGLGIMTFSMLFLIFIGKRISLYSQLCVPDLSQDMGSKNVRYSVFLIFVMTFVIESVGAVLLFLNLKNYHSISFAAYSSIFHSISAFCNSGFSIYSDSLMRFNNNPNILLIMMTLIVLGGLGFIVIYDIVTIIRNKKRHNEKIFINLHTKIALAGSLFFIIFGAISIWLLENRGLMRDMPVAYQFFNSFFLSVTSRTAGFNTVDISLLSSPTLLLLISLMFIGGCPGSTAGGIKIHTFLSVFALIRNKMKGLEMASLFGRKIPNDTVDRALTIFISSLLIIFVAVFLLQLIENKLVPHLQVKLREGFLDFLFESVSAFGTVGLSTGATSYLSFWGKAITIFLMLIGRIGPLTLGIALQTRQKSKIVYEFPNEEIIVS
ncbi:MAG: hypothetical protein JW847_02165 [Candidatus Omnitrophica bacterium]|nr:hypothetical protein [Candidatus Omnitrophota bacterium]